MMDAPFLLYSARGLGSSDRMIESSQDKSGWDYFVYGRMISNFMTFSFKTINIFRAFET